MKKLRSILEFQSNQVVVTHDEYYNFQLAFTNFQSKEKINELKQKYNKLLFNNTFDELCKDIFYSYYNKNLEILSEQFIQLRYLINHRIVSYLVKSETHIEQRTGPNSTVQEHDASFYAMFLAIVEILSNLDEYLKESQKDKLEKLDDQIDKLEKLKKQIEKQKKENSSGSNFGSDSGSGNNMSNIDYIMKNENDLRENIKQFLNSIDNISKKAVEDGLKSAKETIEEESEDVEKIFGGYQRGYQEGELVKIPVHQRIELAKKLRNVEILKKIVVFLGRFKLIAEQKQIDAPSNVRIGITGYKRGDDLSKVFQTRMSDISGDEISKLEFMMDWSEKSLPMINPPPLIKKKNVGKGSVVICVDTSGSMYGIKEYKSKALALSVAEIAYQQKRNFACILFSSKSNVPIVITIKPDETLDIISGKVIQIAEDFIGGGTDFELPLKEALSIIEKDEFNNADILFLTDGFADISDDFLINYKKIKEEKQIKTVGLLLDATDYEREEGKKELEKFCDEVKNSSSIEKDLEFNTSDDIAEEIFSSLLI